MNKLLLAVLSILFIISCTSNEKNRQGGTINISGKVEFPADNMQVKLIKTEGFNKNIVDSAIVQADSTFDMKLHVSAPGSYFMQYGRDFVQVWIENEDLVLNFRGKVKAKNRTNANSFVKIEGGPNNDLLNDLNAFNLVIRTLEDKWKRNTLMLLDNDKAEYFKNQQSNILDEIQEQKTFMANYIIDKYSDCNSAVLLLPYLQGPELEAVITKLEISNPGNPYLPEYKKNALEKEAARKTAEIGHLAPEFSYPDLEGKQVSIRDFKGKLLIVDFWASWCAPCLAEIPNLKVVYDKYHDKGVEILSVSLDKDIEKWKKAIADEQMPWPQICSDDTGIKLMKDYQFNGIPFVILLDSEGKIAAKQLRGKMLTEEIEKLLNKNLH
jgi:peroxiredoxin